MESKITFHDLYSAIIDDCYDYIISNMDEETINEINDSKSKDANPEINQKVDIISTMLLGIKKKTKNEDILEMVKSFFNNLSTFPNIGFQGNILDNNICYYAFGVLKGFKYLLDTISDEEVSSFNIFSYKKYQILINTYYNYEEMNNYYKKRYNKYKNTNKENINVFWLKLLLSKEISTINIKKKKKNKNINIEKNKDENKNVKNNESETDNKNVIIYPKNIKNNNSSSSSEEKNINISNNIINSNIDNQLNNNINENNINNININLNNAQNNNGNIIHENNQDRKDKEISEIRAMIETLMEEQKQMKKDKKFLLDKIHDIEKHLILMHNQSALYQTSRDIGKSIFHYLYLYWHLGEVKPLNEEMVIVLNNLTNNNNIQDSSLNDDLKKKLIKFLKYIYFMNEYLNKMLHKRLKSSTEKMLKDLKNDENYYKLFPGFYYTQWFESLNFFVNDTTSNEEIQKILKDVYDEYISFSKIREVLDLSKEVIDNNGDKISILITENEINDVKEYFKKIKINNNSLENWCNITPWFNGKIAEWEKGSLLGV